MAQTTSGIRGMLSSPHVYSLFQALMGARSGWTRFVARYVRPVPGDHILDLGCGPADVLNYLPEVDYWGYDISEAYIAQARQTHGDRGHLRCKLLTQDELSELPQFDTVIASGLLHHLDDDVAQDLIALAHAALRPGGRLVTIDPCLVPGQNPVARFLIERDRGRNVRDQTGYTAIASRVFAKVMVEVRHKAWIPYTHCFMECTKT
jgi:SAM-dependent methyltransferase